MAANEHVDVLVIGGGPGGTPAAMALAGAGKQVLLVEAGRGLGGTCLFEGCIPSKIFRETAARRHEVARAGDFGLRLSSTGAPDIDWAAVQTRRHHILSGRAQGALAHTKALPSLDVVFARARLTGARTALIETPDAQRRVTFDHAILATGSVPTSLPIPGAELPGVINSEQLIEISAIPRSMVLVGAGPIGVEMAQIFAMLGSRVTILEAADRILGPVDAVLAARLEERLVRDGIEVHKNASVTSITGEAAHHRTMFSVDGKDMVADAEVVVIVTGRHPNVAGLGLGATRIRSDRHGVIVDATLQTDEPGIYATGDLLGDPMFAHWATAQALAVARHLLGAPVEFPRREHNSAVIFSYPEIGMAGLTEEAARAAGMDVDVAEYDYKADARAQISGEADGLLRIVYLRGSHRIVGIHVLVEGAADLMGEAALATRLGLTIQDLASAIHPHPTLTEAFGLAALSVRG
jgi:dihydrolipoamide dehydrogenase